MAANTPRQASVGDLLNESVLLVDMHFHPSGEAGLLLPGGAIEPGGGGLVEERPKYDALRRELWFLGMLVKKLKQPAPNQKKVSLCFEDQHWERELFDPLEPSGDIDPRKRFFDTVAALNHNHCNAGWLEFHTDGGEACYWIEGPKAQAYLAARGASHAGKLSVVGA